MDPIDTSDNDIYDISFHSKIFDTMLVRLARIIHIRPPDGEVLIVT
jgi:hypothetical protein